MLRKYVQTAKPDMITNDMYYFREKRLNQTKGGTVIPFYGDLNRYRIVANDGRTEAANSRFLSEYTIIPGGPDPHPFLSAATDIMR